MLRKKFLVLGIGPAQADLLELLHGTYEIHGLSNSPLGHGRKFCDVFAEIDISLQEAVLSYARNHSVDFVYSVGSDVAMPAQTYVAEHMGLPTLASHETAIVCKQKDLMRARLASCYGAVAFVLFDPSVGHGAGSELALPVVVKPVDSQGQRGVSTVRSPDQFDAAVLAATAASPTGRVIVEDFIDGREVSVHCYVEDGELRFFLPSDRGTWDGLDGGLIRKHVFPCTASARALARVRRLAEECICSLGLRNGPVYFQIKIRDDHPFLIEVTPRLDGCHMWRLILEVSGVNLLQATIDHLVSGHPNIPSFDTIHSGFLEFLCQPPDTEFCLPECRRGAAVTQFYYSAGDLVRRVNGSMEKCGYQIMVEH